MHDHTKLADAGVVTSVGGWLFMHADHVTLALQWSVAIVAIIAGSAAAYYHFKAGRRL